MTDDTLPNEDSREFADVEIYVRPSDEEPLGDDELVYGMSYETLASFHTHTVVGMMDMFADEIGAGRWEVGIRERGDEQYSQRLEITPLGETYGPTAELENQVAAILNHWRE